MYQLANKVSAEQLAAIAGQAYNEMLQAGYTSVAEFHYLHRDPGADGDAMFQALQIAAANSGIRLIYVPVLYERAGFDNSEPTREQQQPFVLPLQNNFSRITLVAPAMPTTTPRLQSVRTVCAPSQQSRSPRLPM